MSEQPVGWLDDHTALEHHLMVAMRHAAQALSEHDTDARDSADRALAHITPRMQRAAARWRFWAFMRTVGRYARRGLTFHQPGCPCLGEDEAALLGLCQDLRDARQRRASARAHELVDAAVADKVLRYGAALVTRTIAPDTQRGRDGRHATGKAGASSDVPRRLH